MPEETLGTGLQAIADEAVPAATEGESTEAAAPPPPEDRAAKKWGEIARAERARISRETKTKQREHALNRREQEANQFFQNLEQNPLDALEKRGWSMQRLTQYALGEGSKPDDDLSKAFKEIEALKAERAAEKQAAWEAQQTQNSHQVMRTIANEYESNEARYPYLAAYTSQEIADVAFKMAVAEYQQTGRDFPADYFLTKLESDVAARYKRVEARRAAQQVLQPVTTSTPKQPISQGSGRGPAARRAEASPRTLTNQHAATVTKIPVNAKPLTRAQRIERARSKISG